jgi:dimethylhistidine N-methyltransferase
MQTAQLTLTGHAPVSGHSVRFAQDVQHGLSQLPKNIPSGYLYDYPGSKLYHQLTLQQEYYLTACECEILRVAREHLAERLGQRPFNLVDLGGGLEPRTMLLIESFMARRMEVQYVPLDITRSTAVLLDAPGPAEPFAAVSGIVNRSAGTVASILKTDGAHPSLVLLLGSAIGSLPQKQAVQLLRRLKAALKPNDLVLIGFDLKKESEILEGAYHDRQGIAARWHLNVLSRINRELGGTFKPEHFLFHCGCNSDTGELESWLVSSENQYVYIGALRESFFFKKGEKIRVAAAHKYSRAEINRLANAGGFAVVNQWYDEKKYFADSLWRA